MPVELETLRRDLQHQVRQLTEDLRERSDTVDAIRDRLQREYGEARDSGRTAATYNEWREGMLTQGAVAWVLGGVFVRFLEDNKLLPEPFITGPGERARQARERRDGYFREHPTDSDRDYFLDVFRTVGTLPALKELFDERHNPLWQLTLSGDAARALWEFWRRVVPETGELVHDFTDPEWDTRFLGDLYEQLSEYARDKFALLQTPEFVEEFILDRTLEPAIEDFELEEVRLIDPTCGSGHFLIGAFHRLLGRWQRKAPGMPIREQVRKVLAAVAGVDINPFAVNIARFRLLVAALQAEGIRRVKEAPGYHFELAVGDSLLHGLPLDELAMDHSVSMARHKTFGHAYEVEDPESLNRILGTYYQVVVGNPPYITVKDKVLNELYRTYYSSCYKKYSLVVPFVERFFSLCLPDCKGRSGYVGFIVSNSFMKRDFGRKLVEEFLPKKNIEEIIDTSGCYIPGHGTPTLVINARNKAPIGSSLRGVLGVRGEPGVPAEPKKGLVWSSIEENIDNLGYENEFISVTDIDRALLEKHPWSLQGGAAPAIKMAMAKKETENLLRRVKEIGFGMILGEDEIFTLSSSKADARRSCDLRFFPLVEGVTVRDWLAAPESDVLFPYDSDIILLREERLQQSLWRYRTLLWARRDFSNKTYREAGRPYWSYHQIPVERNRTPLSITFAHVATHNHFVFDRGGKVFNRSSPVIKLPSGATEDDHLSLLGLLNSSIAMFWMKQVFHGKGQGGVGQESRAEWEQFHEFTGTGLKQFPVTGDKPLDLAKRLDALAQERQGHLPSALKEQLPLARAAVDEHRDIAEDRLGRMVALQEELDWRCYRLYGVLDRNLEYGQQSTEPTEPPPVRLGERAFEIALARRMKAGDLETTWFRRHGSQPVTEVPTRWPEDYRRLVEERIQRIEQDRYINLLERPEHKRRWNFDTWEELEQDTLREWLLDRLEENRYWNADTLQTTNSLAALAQTDQDFIAVAELYLGQSGINVQRLVAELVEGESVPLLPVLRYKKDGLRKRADWERTWELQRQEDAIDAEVAATMTRSEDESEEAFQQRLQDEQRKQKQQRIGDIPVPPKYKTADFLNTTFWRLRGSLDVPKERFFSLPHCSPDGDDSLLIGWAGWDSLKRLQAVAGCYTDRRQESGWPAARLTPLLAAMDELLPWVKQWHNEPDPEFGRMGDFFETYLASQLQELGLTRADLTAWTPPVTRRRKQ